MRQTDKIRAVPGAPQGWPTIRAGSVVRLISGSPQMAVVSLIQTRTTTRHPWWASLVRKAAPPTLTKELARCLWFDECGQLNTADIPLDALKTIGGLTCQTTSL